MITNILIKLIYDYNFVIGMSFNLLFVKLVVGQLLGLWDIIYYVETPIPPELDTLPLPLFLLMFEVCVAVHYNLPPLGVVAG